LKGIFSFVTKEKMPIKGFPSSPLGMRRDKGKRRWGSAVAGGYGGTSWGRGKEPFLEKVFPSSPSSHHPYFANFM
jgi:hypothetical protein